MRVRDRVVIGAVLVLAAAGCTSPSGPAGPTISPHQVSGGWLITVYYTAVESYHTGPPTQVYGCPRRNCAFGDVPLGNYPLDFIGAVRDEGAGRITSGPRAGGYLNWSSQTGYWADDAPRDSRGEPLEPFVSAAADPDVLAAGTNFLIADCGTVESGEKPPAEVCEKIRSGRWQIRDEFTPGFGGPRHIDLYLGPEQGPKFTSSQWYISLTNAIIIIE